MSRNKRERGEGKGGWGGGGKGDTIDPGPRDFQQNLGKKRGAEETQKGLHRKPFWSLQGGRRHKFQAFGSRKKKDTKHSCPGRGWVVLGGGGKTSKGGKSAGKRGRQSWGVGATGTRLVEVRGRKKKKEKKGGQGKLRLFPKKGRGGSLGRGDRSFWICGGRVRKTNKRTSANSPVNPPVMGSGVFGKGGGPTEGGKTHGGNEFLGKIFLYRKPCCEQRESEQKKAPGKKKHIGARDGGRGWSYRGGKIDKNGERFFGVGIPVSRKRVKRAGKRGNERKASPFCHPKSVGRHVCKEKRIFAAGVPKGGEGKRGGGEVGKRATSTCRVYPSRGDGKREGVHGFNEQGGLQGSI